ncbi:MAG TPA: hypothetical protein VFD36_02060 [Kofleriaceae bacterium]|nr:hypothetical protein [Kofleriaceae bacterium]
MSEDEAFEWKLRAAAIPAAIAVAWAFHAWPTGHWLQRTFLSMMVHELGHAVTAWWCGFAAVPTVWKTLIPEARNGLVSVVVLGLEAWICVRGWRMQRMGWMLAGLGLAALQFVATLGTPVSRAQEAITFGGDAGAMVLGTLLMLSFFVGPESRLRTNQLRWGFLAIGAAALVDTFATWFAARTDEDVIPFGEIEGVGLSDPSKLDEVFGWTTRQIVHRHLGVGIACFVVLAAGWLYFTHSARRWPGRGAAP